MFKGQRERTSYALGMNTGNQLKKEAAEVDADLFIQGLKDALAGGKTLLTEGEVKATLSARQSELRAKEMQALKQLAERNKREGEAFLAENKSHEGVVSLPSGLQYRILKAGDGKKPTENDTVVCQYRLTLIDGRELDSAESRNQPATFSVKAAIKGWAEALPLMPVGSRWQLFVPPSLAYGERATAGIGPNATLIFEMELMLMRDKS